MEKIVGFCKRYASQPITVHFKKEDTLYFQYENPIKTIKIVVFPHNRNLYKVNTTDCYRFFSENLQYPDLKNIKGDEELSLFWKKLLNILTPKKLETQKYHWEAMIKRCGYENLLTYEMTYDTKNKIPISNLIKVLSVKNSETRNFDKIDYDERRLLFDSNPQVLPHFKLIFNTYCLYFECPDHCRKAIYYFLLINKKRFLIHKDVSLLIAKMLYQSKNDKCWLRLCKWNSKTRESLII